MVFIAVMVIGVNIIVIFFKNLIFGDAWLQVGVNFMMLKRHGIYMFSCFIQEIHLNQFYYWLAVERHRVFHANWGRALA
jgi:hypothetical protein